MSSVNPLTKELLLKIVYYGPGLAGKTTALTFLHRSASPERRGKLVSLATPVDRTLYFDLTPSNLPRVGPNRVRLQLFTVPGQVHYNATRKLVLTGADGVVFVADSQRARMDANTKSLDNLRDNLAERQIGVDSFPLVFHYNKRDLTDAVEREQLEERLNPGQRPAIETCAITGQGIQRGLELISKEIIAGLELGGGPGRSPEPIDDPIGSAISAATPTLEPPRPPTPDPAPPTEPPGVPTGDTGGSITLATLWQDGERDRPSAIERAIVEGRDREAARMIWRELDRLLTGTGRELSWSSPAGMVTLLGLDGRLYLAVARLAARAADGQPISRDKLLEAYLFLAQTAAVVAD